MGRGSERVPGGGPHQRVVSTDWERGRHDFGSDHGRFTPTSKVVLRRQMFSDGEERRGRLAFCPVPYLPPNRGRHPAEQIRMPGFSRGPHRALIRGRHHGVQILVQTKGLT